MGWRENVARWARDEADGDPDTADALASDIPRVLCGMLDADRIALARELLAGTGRVVAKDVAFRETRSVGVISGGIVDAITSTYDNGWNAARAAMLGDEG